MTIDEAIVSLRKSASKSLDYEWQREQYQIAEWLEELQSYRENSNGYNKEDIELNRNAMYNKAIDDFAILMKETLNHDWATTKISEQIIYNRLFDKCNEIAEQLKAGDNNGT